MEQLFFCGSPVEASAEEVAKEKAALRLVQEEVMEADEANLLEEEDMHIFDREPLQDALPLVSCNACRKPVKASQYAQHAERCQVSCAEQEAAAEVAPQTTQKAPRKGRKRTFSAAETAVGDAGRAQFHVDGDRIFPPIVGFGLDESRSPCGLDVSLGASKRVVPTPDRHAAATAPAMTGIGTAEAGGRKRRHEVAGRPLSEEDLDVMCGVAVSDTQQCQRSLTCRLHCDEMKRGVPGRRQAYDVLLRDLKLGRNQYNRNRSVLGGVFTRGQTLVRPLATKQYCLRHAFRLRGVLGSIFRECLAQGPATLTGLTSSGLQILPSGPPFLATCGDDVRQKQTAPTLTDQRRATKQREKRGRSTSGRNKSKAENSHQFPESQAGYAGGIAEDSDGA